MKRVLSDELAEEIRDKHHAGMTVAELRREYEQAEGTIKQILLGITYKSAGGQIGIVKHAKKEHIKKEPKLSRAQKDEVRALEKSGVSQADLHRQYGVSRAYISRIVKGSR